MTRTLLSALCLAGTLAAAPSSGRDYTAGIIGEDDRVPVVSEGSPWDAIGQVNIAAYSKLGRCTGTLIAPELVVTAAHCVLDPVTKAPLPPRNIHFVAGVRHGQHKGHSTAKCLHFLKKPDAQAVETVQPARPPERVPLSSLRQDVAVIVLSEAMTIEPAALAGEIAPRPGLPLVHVSYTADRRFVLSADQHCRLMHSVPGEPFWFNSCDTYPASSGGPIFVNADGGLKLAAIMLATGNHDANAALPLSVWIDLTRDKNCQ